MTHGFWEGPGWEIANFGRLSEVRLKCGEESHTYLLVFQQEQQGAAQTKQIAEVLINSCRAQESAGVEQPLDGVFEATIQSLKPRTVLTRSDLQALVQSRVPVPDFYKRALQGKLDKVILI